MRIRDVMLLAMSLGGLATGVLWPAFGMFVAPWTMELLMIQLFFSFLGVDFQAMAHPQPGDVLEVGVISAVKLFVLPVLLWGLSLWLLPEQALAILLLSGVSTGVTAPFVATLLGVGPTRMLQVAVLTSALVPFTLPALVSLLMGGRLEIPYSHMARLLALIMLPPGILVFLLKRFTPGVALRLERWSVPVGLPLFYFTTLAVIAPFADAITSEFGRVLESLGLATLLTVIFVACGLGLAHAWPRHLDGLSFALGLTCVNNVLVAVFAARLFGPDPTLLAVLYMFPYFLILLPMRWLARRLKPRGIPQ